MCVCVALVFTEDFRYFIVGPGFRFSAVRYTRAVRVEISSSARYFIQDETISYARRAGV